ncbi:MAG TPA: cyanophycin synthetase, partial [Verrucomicrobiae bacterium]|nr:cyanophycin synthetase [Verrucomicrobiae bacterium]
LALAAVEILQEQIPVAGENIHAGLANVIWPGRLQLITRGSGRKILLDGAHNPAGARTLGETLKKIFPAEKPTLILGVLQDKDWRHICETLASQAVRIHTVPVASERSANPAELAEACRKMNPSAEIVAGNSLADALDKSAGDGFVIITGSLYLVGEALELLGLSPAGRAERGLNEWTSPPPVLLPG